MSTGESLESRFCRIDGMLRDPRCQLNTDCLLDGLDALVYDLDFPALRKNKNIDNFISRSQQLRKPAGASATRGRGSGSSGINPTAQPRKSRPVLSLQLCSSELLGASRADAEASWTAAEVEAST